MNKDKTPEQIELEDISKKMRQIQAKIRLAQEGINTTNISQQKLDGIVRIFDDMEQINRNVQQKKSKIQQDANISMQMLDQEANKKFSDIHQKYQEKIKSLKEEGTEVRTGTEVIEATEVGNEAISTNVQIGPDVIEPEVKEKSNEEKISEITDIVLNNIRESVSNKIEEIMKSMEKRVELILEEGIVEEKDPTKQTTVESSMEEVENKN
jgi:hypothetical protein